MNLGGSRFISISTVWLNHNSGKSTRKIGKTSSPCLRKVKRWRRRFVSWLKTPQDDTLANFSPPPMPPSSLHPHKAPPPPSSHPAASSRRSASPSLLMRWPIDAGFSLNASCIPTLRHCDATRGAPKDCPGKDPTHHRASRGLPIRCRRFVCCIPRESGEPCLWLVTELPSVHS